MCIVVVDNINGCIVVVNNINGCIVVVNNMNGCSASVTDTNRSNVLLRKHLHVYQYIKKPLA